MKVSEISKVGKNIKVQKLGLEGSQLDGLLVK